VELGRFRGGFRDHGVELGKIIAYTCKVGGVDLDPTPPRAFHVLQ